MRSQRGKGQVNVVAVTLDTVIVSCTLPVSTTSCRPTRTPTIALGSGVTVCTPAVIAAAIWKVRVCCTPPPSKFGAGGESFQQRLERVYAQLTGEAVQQRMIQQETLNMLQGAHGILPANFERRIILLLLKREV